MPSASRTSRRSCDVVGRVDDHRLTGLAVADQVDEVDHLAGDRVACAKSRPESSWRKYRRSSPPRRAHRHRPLHPRLVTGQRVEPRHQLLDLGPGPAQTPIELVDQRGRPFQPHDEHVDVDLPLLEEVTMESSSRLASVKLNDSTGAGFRDGHHASSFSPRPAPHRTVGESDHDLLMLADPAALRTTGPSSVSVRL